MLGRKGLNVSVKGKYFSRVWSVKRSVVILRSMEICSLVIIKIFFFCFRVNVSGIGPKRGSRSSTE